MSQEKIQTLITDQLHRRTLVKLNDRLIDDLDADSLDILELSITLEDEFGIRFSDDEKMNFLTVASIVALVKKKTSC